MPETEAITTSTESKPEHGVNAYTKGCHCVRCRRAWALYQKEYRRRRSPQQIAQGRRAERGYFFDKLPSTTVRLTSLGMQILEHAAARTDQGADDIIEQALRQCGGCIEFGQV